MKEDNIGFNLKLFNKTEACWRVMFVNNTCLYCVGTLACVSRIGLKLAARKGRVAGDWRKLRNENIRYVDCNHM